MGSKTADVWILTESEPDCSPGSDYEQIVCCPRHGLNVNHPNGCFVAIWVRRSCRDEGWTFTSMEVLAGHGSRMACIRIEQPGKRDVLLVGTVLPWRSDPQWPGGVGFCAALAAQAVEWRHLWGNRSAGFCVAGDFNQSLPFSPYGTRDGASALERTLQSLGLHCLTGYENDPRPAVANHKPSIDHICASDALQRVGPVDCWCIEEDRIGPNGHAGVLVELQQL